MQTWTNLTKQDWQAWRSFTLTAFTPALRLMLGLAVGIDYAAIIRTSTAPLRARLGLWNARRGRTTLPSLPTRLSFLFARAHCRHRAPRAADARHGVRLHDGGHGSRHRRILAIALSLTALPALLGLLGRGRQARTQPVRPHRGHRHSRFGRILLGRSRHRAPDPRSCSSSWAWAPCRCRPRRCNSACRRGRWPRPARIGGSPTTR